MASRLLVGCAAPALAPLSMASAFAAFFGFGSKPTKYPGKYAVVPEVISWCLSSELFKELDTIMADAGKDGGMGTMEEKEFKLLYTDKHKQFVSNFEKRMEAFIESRKCTVQEFYEMCKKAQEMGDDGIETFIEILTSVLEFQSFVDLCRDPKKRQYVQGVLAQYAKMLTADEPPKKKK